VGDDFPGFRLVQHRRQPLRVPGAYHIVNPGQIDVQHALVEKKQCRERLRLSGRRDLQVGRQMAEESPDLIATHVFRVLAAVELDEAEDPVDMSFLSAEAVVAEADLGAHRSEEAGRAGHGGSRYGR
jgi:hypothetical protein